MKMDLRLMITWNVENLKYLRMMMATVAWRKRKKKSSTSLGRIAPTKEDLYTWVCSQMRHALSLLIVTEVPPHIRVLLDQSAGKCESSLDIDDPNENGCTFIEGVKIIRKSGIVSTETPAPSKTASAFIGMFAVSTCLLGAYVYFLKSKMDKSKINLASS